MYIVCMPTIVRYGAYTIIIIPGDHLPPHVHCVGPDGSVKIEITTRKVMKNKGVGAKDVRRLQDQIEHYEDILMDSWRFYNEKN